MAFTDAYNLNWTLTVNDAENVNAPFKDSKARSFKANRVGANPGGSLPGLFVVPFATDPIIDVTALNGLGIVTMENIDATNFFDYGPTAAGVIVPLGRLLPGESYAWRLTPGIVLRVQADTADVRAIIRIYEN